MKGFTKLFGCITTSSVWLLDDQVLRVWIAMLAECDADGVVEGSVPGFANLARVSVADMRRAIDILAGPDEDSRTPDHEGRRIEKIQGGWRILNYRAYRERGQDRQGSNAPYAKAYRDRQRNLTQPNALDLNLTRYTEAEAEAEAEKLLLPPLAPPSPPSTETKPEAQPDPKPRTKQARRKALESTYSEAVVRSVMELLDAWPRTDTDGRSIHVDVAMTVSRVHALIQTGKATIAELMGAASDYLATPKNFRKAPQWFFGTRAVEGGDDPLWMTYVQGYRYRNRVRTS